MPAAGDPLASLNIWPITINVADTLYTIEAKPAAEWLIAIFEEFGSFEAIIEMLPVGAKASIEQEIIDETVTIQDVEETFRDAVEAVAGRPWWMVLNYLNMARSYWGRLHGRLLATGLDPNRISLAAYLDAIHFCLIDGREDQAVQKIQNFLDTPPAGVTVELDEDDEAQTFLSMLNQAR